jgi:hypothetical protein
LPEVQTQARISGFSRSLVASSITGKNYQRMTGLKHMPSTVIRILQN